MRRLVEHASSINNDAKVALWAFSGGPEKGAVTFSGGYFPGFRQAVRHRTCGGPHEAHVRRAKQNRVDGPAHRWFHRFFFRPQWTLAFLHRMAPSWKGTPRQPFNFTPMGVNPISPGPPRVRCTPMWALSTCGGPDEIGENTHPEDITALFREQIASSRGSSRRPPCGRGFPRRSPPGSRGRPRRSRKAWPVEDRLNKKGVPAGFEFLQSISFVCQRIYTSRLHDVGVHRTCGQATEMEFSTAQGLPTGVTQAPLVHALPSAMWCVQVQRSRQSASCIPSKTFLPF